MLIWRLDQPYRHRHGSIDESTVIYIEKTRRSIRERWSAHIGTLVAGTFAPDFTEPDDLRNLINNNLGFYSKAIGTRGPLEIWWADVPTMDAASDGAIMRRDAPARDWERLMLEHYKERYRYYPLKNRRR